MPPRGCIWTLLLPLLLPNLWLCAHANATTPVPPTTSSPTDDGGTSTSTLSASGAATATSASAISPSAPSSSTSAPAVALSSGFIASTPSSPIRAATTSSGPNSPAVKTSRSATLKYRDPLVFLPQGLASACPSRTVNYITHTLPQQCLRTSRVALGNGTGASGNGTVAVGKVVNGTAGVVNGTQGSGQDIHTVKETHQKEEAATRDGLDAIVPVSGSATGEEMPRETQAEAGFKSDLELEHDSPLDTSKFLSFEEWKKQNLEKVGQSPENVGQGRTQNSEGRRRPINNALDTLGEEGEIELDFGGFGHGDGNEGGSRYTPSADTATKAADTAGSDQSAPASARHRSKDAGKTCKERFNYASFDCAATILKTNPQCKSSSSVLVENKDSYMLNECSADNKFLILELCDDILVDTIVVANFEFFSSMFRTFKVSVSDRYPVKHDRWKTLGTFEARNTREIQAFLVENPLIWARYLRIEFLTHYGSEFYCPVSLVRVHGTTMMEEFRHQDDAVRGDDDAEDEVEEEAIHSQSAAVEVTSTILPEPTKPETIGETTLEPAVEKDVESTVTSVVTVVVNGTMSASDLPAIASNSTIEQSEASPTIPHKDPETNAPKAEETVPSSNLDTATEKHATTSDTATSQGPEPKPSAARLDASKSANETTSKVATASPLSLNSKSNVTALAGESTNTTMTASAKDSTNTTSMMDTPKSVETSSIKVESKATKTPVDSKVEGKAKATAESKKPAPSAAQPPPAQPSTQESFFKATNKRLNMLETNSSLNIQYIEEQSRILRDAFVQTEKHQLRKTEKFLQHLNDTVVAELKGFRQQYDQLWQSTVIELETHREQNTRDMLAVSSRLTLMADELVFQKRMIVVQSVLLLLSLGLVVFVRSGKDYTELPLMQQVVTKSQSMLRLGNFESPPGSPVSGRDSSPEFRRRMRKLARLVSPESDARPDSRGSDISLSYEKDMRPDGAGTPNPKSSNPGLRFEPPTPEPSVDGRSDRSRSPTLSPEEVALARETRSGPATPSGTRENQPLDWGSPADEMEGSPTAVVTEAGSPPAPKNNNESPSSSSSLVRKNMPTVVGRRPSPLRYSETDEQQLLDEDASQHAGERSVLQSIENKGRTQLSPGAASSRKKADLEAKKASVNGGSSDDGDTAGDIMDSDGFD